MKLSEVNAGDEARKRADLWLRKLLLVFLTVVPELKFKLFLKNAIETTYTAREEKVPVKLEPGGPEYLVGLLSATVKLNKDLGPTGFPTYDVEISVNPAGGKDKAGFKKIPAWKRHELSRQILMNLWSELKLNGWEQLELPSMFAPSGSNVSNAEFAPSSFWKEDWSDFD